MGTVQAAMHRIPTLRMILHDIDNGTAAGEKDIERWAGILNWATIAHVYLKPFMYHVYAWLAISRQRPRVTPPRALRTLARAMLHLLDHPPATHEFYLHRTPLKGASDAAAYDADSDNLACMGGWWTRDDWPTKSTCDWYSIKVARKHKWAYKQDSSQRRVAALELMGTLVLYKLITQQAPVGLAQTTTTLSTDNLGNTYGINKERFKKWPNCDIALELALTAYSNGNRINTRHVKRDANQWADQLSNDDTTGFDPTRRHEFVLDDHRNWLLWHQLWDGP
jgi:hypothetical protein